MRTAIIIFTASLLFFLNVGCATILNGDTQDIAFDSEPPGAYVSIDNVRQGVTPCVIPVPRKNWSKQITIVKPGYKTEMFKLENDLSGKTLLNVLWFPGAIVDGISGRGGHYKDSVKVILVRGTGVNNRENEDDKNGDSK